MTIRAIAAALLLTASPLAAQEATNVVDNKQDWTIYEEPSPTDTKVRECFATSQPTETLNTSTATGQPKAVNRGMIRLFVAYSSDGKRKGDIAFTGGYPFKPGSTVNLKIGDNSFELFTQGEWAWPESPAADERIRSALRAGANAVLTARSQRGTTTKDTFSLTGFTAASEDAQKRCK